MHARVNMLAGDPALLADATRYLEGTVRPHVEGQHGNRGLACLVNAELGTCVIASYWDSLDAMTASEQSVQVSRKEMTERLRGSVTVEHYEVPVFVRRSRPMSGAGVRLTRIECPPGNIDAFIEEFRSTAIPALMDMTGLSSAHLLADRATGRCVVVTAWQDTTALAVHRAAIARLRADVSATLHLQVRSVEEYALMFSSVRDGDTRSLIERDAELWNAKDREGWMSAMDLLRLETETPAGRLPAGTRRRRCGTPGSRHSRTTGSRRSPSTPTTGAACTSSVPSARTRAPCAGRPAIYPPPAGRPG